MEKFQGIFDQGFSGIIGNEENPRHKMIPDFLDKLAEQENDYEPELIDTPNISFDKDSGLSRANELTSDGSRESSIQNRFTVEKNQRVAQDNQIKNVEKFVQSMIDKGSHFDEINVALLSKFPRDLANKYLESTIKLILNKYAYLGFENLSEKQASIVEQSKIDFKIKRSMVRDILDKFSKLEYISNGVTKEYSDLLGSKRPLYIVAKFLFSLNSIKNNYFENKEARTAFKRDVDDKMMSLRDVNNNFKKNSNIEKQNVWASMLNEYKQGVYNKRSRSQINQKMAKTFGVDKLQDFHSKFKDDITKVERFSSRQTFSTDFASAVQQGVEIQPKSKPIVIDSKAMLNYAFDLMTNGNDLDQVHTSLKKKFGYEASTQFLAEYDYKLNKHYGQLGYLFIDSNIYANCDEMANSFSKLQHSGSKLIYSLRANSKCIGCSLHKEGSCEKTGLLISNNPLVRSPRAAKRVFQKACSFVPQIYINVFVAQVKNEESNLELVSKFALGIKQALETESKNIGKQASKDRTETTHMQESFVGPDNSHDVELFKEQSSSIIDDVLNETFIKEAESNSDLKKLKNYLKQSLDPSAKGFKSTIDKLKSIDEAEKFAYSRLSWGKNDFASVLRNLHISK